MALIRQHWHVRRVAVLGHLHKCSPVVSWLGRWPWWWCSSSGWPWRWGWSCWTFTQVSGQPKTQQIQSFQFSFASYALVGKTILMYFFKELAKLLVTDTQLFWDGSVIARRQEQKCWIAWLSGTLIYNLLMVNTWKPAINGRLFSQSYLYFH